MHTTTHKPCEGALKCESGRKWGGTDYVWRCGGSTRKCSRKYVPLIQLCSDTTFWIETFHPFIPTNQVNNRVLAKMQTKSNDRERRRELTLICVFFCHTWGGVQCGVSTICMLGVANDNLWHKYSLCYVPKCRQKYVYVSYYYFMLQI